MGNLRSIVQTLSKMLKACGLIFDEYARMFAFLDNASAGLGYEELRKTLCLVRRNSRGQRGSVNIHRKLLEACLAYTKKRFRIVSVNILERLAAALRELGIAKPRARILSYGEAKALEMQVQFRRQGVFKWAPRVENWLNDIGYRLWLGTVQVSLMNSLVIYKGADAAAAG